MKNKQQQENQRDKKEKKNALEWAIFGISLLLVLAVIGYLVYHVFEYESKPPMLEVEYSEASSPYSPYRYKVTVYNRGGSTAEQVQVKLMMKDNGTKLEEATINYPWVPQSSKRIGYVVFTTAPTKADKITAQVVSFQVP